MAIVVGAVGRLGEGETARAFVRGVVDIAGPAFLVTVAWGVSVLMTNTQTIDTVLSALEGPIAGASSVVLVLPTHAVALPLAFLVIRGDRAGDPGVRAAALILTAWSIAGGWPLRLLPTNAILTAGLALARFGFDQYLRFVLMLMAILLAVTLGVLWLGAAL